MSRSLARVVAFCSALLAAAALVVVTESGASAARAPRVPAGLPRAIEGMPGYVGQVSCDPRVRPGTARLARLLTTTYPGIGASWASAYACGTDGSQSEHYEGRAIDWMVDVHRPAQLAAAKAVIKWLFATDRYGNHYAMARRLGVMYVIFNNRMWGGWSGRWEDYNGCSVVKALKARGNDNSCHRTHMHISLDWNGAMGTTSFWTKKVWATNYGPCRSRDLNWALRYRQRNTRPCAEYPTVRPGRGASATKRELVTYSGAEVMRGSRGPAVSAVQRALHVPVTGVYNVATVRAVRAFQAARHLPTHGVMSPKAWRALLRSTR